MTERYRDLACDIVAVDRELAIDLLAVIDGLGSLQTSNPMIARLRAFREALEAARGGVHAGRSQLDGHDGAAHDVAAHLDGSRRDGDG